MLWLFVAVFVRLLMQATLSISWTPWPVKPVMEPQSLIQFHPFLYVYFAVFLIKSCHLMFFSLFSSAFISCS
jgi:hypothetical protein